MKLHHASRSWEVPKWMEDKIPEDKKANKPRFGVRESAIEKGFPTTVAEDLQIYSRCGMLIPKDRIPTAGYRPGKRSTREGLDEKCP